MISDFFDKNLIQLNVEAKNREEAIRIAAQPLVDYKKISTDYVDNILKVLEKTGPYFVLLPQVALPHARSEEGALENAIGITTLKHPVEFKSETNDPIKYLFVISAIDNNVHLGALSMLAELFEKASFFEFLDNATSPKEILNYLKDVERSWTDV
ncbi:MULTISPECIES: PTS sugar transporter subunit IIA [Terrabacteria group]|uniref:PTS sugar transporter subunit IIA n=1 Tax=Bacillati TaxID=1783272 RepID=UPI00193AA4DD|nr:MULTISPECIES: PTS sugar transporter subunit IIA [Terrabacteria group]MBW9213124.1 PTS sugar transporter subunit IIA [Trueperella sp. zg.1013]QRG86948.1 PTS sugar transporter subunit IIA [Bulleidia sp. zg-1006]